MKAVILFAAIASSLGAQPAGVQGTVADQASGKPLDRVHVTLMTAAGAEDGDAPYGAMSDSAGRFSVSNLPPGRYLVILTRTGFVQTADSSNVTIKDGEQLTGLKLKMVRAAMVEGRVTDEFGDPMPGVLVAMAPVPPTKVSPTVKESLDTQTDERGAFRFLTGPGKYRLLATPQRNGRSGPPEIRSDGTADSLYGPTYYPNSPNKERASVLEVIAGRDIDGLEIHLTSPASRRPLNVSGTVTGVPPEGHVIVLLVPTSMDQLTPVWAEVKSDGKFSISGLSPGVYNVNVHAVASKKSLHARAIVKLEASDITNLELALTEATEVVGTVEMGGAPADRRTIHLEGLADFTFGGDASSTEIGADGSFRIADVWPGKFSVSVDPLPDTAYIKTVEVDGAAAADGLVEVPGGRAPRLKVLLALDGAAVSGKFSSEGGDTAPEETTVMLLTDPKQTRGAKSSRVQNGKYRLTGIRPGKYRLIAVSGDSDDPGWEETIQMLFDAAEDIELHPAERLTKDLGDAKKQ